MQGAKISTSKSKEKQQDAFNYIFQKRKGHKKTQRQHLKWAGTKSITVH